MSKRQANGSVTERPHKRTKSTDTPLESAAPQPIDSAKQLKQLLDFHQDQTYDLKTGIQAFKAFLESIHYATEGSSTSRQQNILHEYLQSQIPKHASETSSSEAIALPNLMQAWSFAAQTNNESLLSAIPAIFALLLRTISTLIDFREYGLQLGRTVLQQSQLKLLSRALTSPKHKEHLISPCLRLLTEVVSFDGGSLANKILASSNSTLDSKTISRNLHLRKNDSENLDESRRRPTVRTNTVRYLLACIKYFPGQEKLRPIADATITRALFEHIKDDSVENIKEIFESLKTNILLDKKIPRSAKAKVFNENCLINISNAFKDSPSEATSSEKASEHHKVVYEFLRFVCSSPEAGVLRPYAGWYPSINKNESFDEEAGSQSAIDLGLDSIDWYDSFTTQVPVRNIILSKIAQSLRPHASTLEANLLLQIFKSAPEIVADFFFRKSTFAFDPKLTVTWIGYSSFLFSTISLPLPAYFGRKTGYDRIPPPVSIVIENILPQPLTQKCSTRCLNQSVDLITFFTLRILNVAFQKAEKVFKVFDEASASEGALWVEASQRLRKEFITRCPNFKTVIDVFRQTAPDNELQKEAALRLIALYYEVIPEVTLDEKFDVAFALGEAIAVQEQPSEDNATNQQGLKLLQLGHLLRISATNSDMRWFQKPEGKKLSPFMSLLKIASLSKDVPTEVFDLVSSIIQENNILQGETELLAMSALLASLRGFGPSEDLTGLYDFLDDVFARLVRKPVKYEDDLADLTLNRHSTGPISLLHMTLLEQWPFAVERSNHLDLIGLWLSLYFDASELIGEDNDVLDRIRYDAAEEVALKDELYYMLWGPIQPEYGANMMDLIEFFQPDDYFNEEDESDLGTVARSKPDVDFTMLAPPTEDPKHRGLHRWNSKDTESAIVEGDLASLILCLSSTYPEVQKLALGSLRQFSLNLEQVKSSYAEAPQILLLVGLLINTVTPLISRQSSNHQSNGISTDNLQDDTENIEEEQRGPTVPYFCTSYAIMALQILQDPLHPLYQLINNFHTLSPRWDIDRLPSYWTNKILFEAPQRSYTTTTTSRKPPQDLSNYDVDQDSTTFSLPKPVPRKTHGFLLSYVHASLRNPNRLERMEDPNLSADLHILQNKGTLEPLLAQANNPFQPLSHFILLVRILWRVTFLPGGSTMLITRKGIVGVLSSWIAKRKSFSKNLTLGQTPAQPHNGDSTGGGDERPELRQDRLLASAWGLKKLLRRIWDSCDRDYVDKWSQGMMANTILQITES